MRGAVQLQQKAADLRHQESADPIFAVSVPHCRTGCLVAGRAYPCHRGLSRVVCVRPAWQAVKRREVKEMSHQLVKLEQCETDMVRGGDFCTGFFGKSESRAWK